VVYLDMGMLSVNTGMEIIVRRYKSDGVRLVDVTCVERGCHTFDGGRLKRIRVHMRTW
jgi:hypothetical protein